MTDTTDYDDPNEIQYPPPEPLPAPAASGKEIRQAAQSIARCLQNVMPGIVGDDLAEDIHHALTAPNMSERMDDIMVMQSRVLDSIFNRLVDQGMAAAGADLDVISAALRAQKQTRDAFRTVSRLNNMRKKLYEANYRRR